MSAILSPAVVQALASDIPPAFIRSHEALRKQARIGWDTASAVAAHADSSTREDVHVDVVLDEDDDTTRTRERFAPMSSPRWVVISVLGCYSGWIRLRTALASADAHAAEGSMAYVLDTQTGCVVYDGSPDAYKVAPVALGEAS